MQSQPEKTRDFKRAQRGRFILKKCFLDERAKKQILNIPQDSPTENMQTVIAGVESGEFECADVFHEGRKVGLTVFRIEENEAGREFLSIASFGTDEADLTQSIIPILCDIARNFECQTIRLHTMRPGLCQKLLNMGWFASEIVMRNEL